MRDGMVDREKVIKGLEACRLKNIKCKDRGCPYIDSRQSYACFLELYADVLALLKEQEPVMVKYTTSTIRCPKCNKQITSRGAIHNEIKFCWKCGQAVKWE